MVNDENRQPLTTSLASAPESDLADGHKLTPMLRQYLAAKKECLEALLLFRMGDFYEFFFEDAKIAAKELELTLTSRDKGPDAIPMAGVPHHAVSGYIARLVERGYTVAICDQMEDARKCKGLVKREITRLVTPGTNTDSETLNPAALNYLAYVLPKGRESVLSSTYVAALLDILSGELLCLETTSDKLSDELQQLGVKEVLVNAEDAAPLRVLLGEQNLVLRVLQEAPPLLKTASALLTRYFGTDFISQSPGGGSELEKIALAAVITFAEHTQKCVLKHLEPPKFHDLTEYLRIDAATRKNLELALTSDNQYKGSLRWHLDRTRTAMGSRLLLRFLFFPLRDEQQISERLALVGYLKENRDLRLAINQVLEGIRDIERLLGRINIGRATPKDLLALKCSLNNFHKLKILCLSIKSELALVKNLQATDDLLELKELLEYLSEEAPTQINEGGIFKAGFNPELDELLELSQQGHGFLVALEQRERQRTNIHNLKVRYNRVFGYYIEITKANLKEVPADYIRKQTLVGGERFITAELKAYEEKVLTADEKKKALEEELFRGLLEKIATFTAKLRVIANLIAKVDVFGSLAEVADEGRYSAPVLIKEQRITLLASRHPVLERLQIDKERFVPNDLYLDTEKRQLLIVTGPNMSGKSTIMRQLAICTLLAHMGSFVPAKSAHIALCDKLFTRVGASDNLTRGQSTFMVEMQETANILRYATKQSLVLLDEIGRGTSTFDGVSIAFAVAEYIHDEIGCLTMFATHYHELAELAQQKERIINVSVAVKEQAGKVVFLRRLIDGASSHSYGIEVAKLANLPQVVVERAQQILQRLEAVEGRSQVAKISVQQMLTDVGVLNDTLMNRSMKIDELR